MHNEIYLQRHFGKTYKDNEEASRKSALEKNIEYIYLHNTDAKSGKHKYTLGMNQFSDLVNINV